MTDPTPTMPEGYSDLLNPNAVRVRGDGSIPNACVARVDAHRGQTGVWHPFYVTAKGTLTPYVTDAARFTPAAAEAAARQAIAAIKGSR